MFKMIENFVGPMPWIAIGISLLLIVVLVIGCNVKHTRKVKRERKVSRLNSKARIALAGFDDESVPRNIWD